MGDRISDLSEAEDHGRLFDRNEREASIADQFSEVERLSEVIARSRARVQTDGETTAD